MRSMIRYLKHIITLVKRFWILWISIVILLYSRFSLPFSLPFSTIFDSDSSFKSIAGLIIEYEDFYHNLPSTVSSMQSLVSSMAIYNERFLYPPLSKENIQEFHRIFDKFRFFEQKRSVLDTFSSLNIESFFEESDFILIFSDSSRPIAESKEEKLEVKLQEIASSMERDKIDAVIFPIIKEYINEESLILCHPFTLDIKHWTLVYHPEKGYLSLAQNSSCEFQNEDGFVLLISKSKFFSLHKPLLRPFAKSFALQASIQKLSIRLEEPLFTKRSTKGERRDKRLMEKKRALEEYRKLKLYQELGIKKVVKEDKEERFYGCQRESSRCFGSIYDGMPDFLYQDRLLPPCCRRHLEITGRYVLQILTQAGVRHWLEGGSLLGAARDGQIIDWDFDIDIGFYREDLAKLGKPIELLLISKPGSQLEDSQGFVWEKATEGDFLRVHFSKHNRIHVDLFPFYSKNGTMTKDTWFADHPQDCEFPESFLEQLTTMEFIGVNASVPRNVKEFLEFKFGEGVIENPRMPGDFKVEHFRS